MDVYLDTNAVSYFDAFPPDWDAAVLAIARERLIELVEDGSISVFVSYVLLNELLGISESDPQKYLRVLDFLWRVAKNNLLWATDDLGRAEVRNRALLEGNDRLEWWINAVTVRRACGDLRALEAIPKLTRKQIEKFEADEEARRDEARRKMEVVSGVRVLEGSRRWWGSAEEKVDDWVRDFMQNSRERLGLPEDSSTWPEPTALQSIWRFHAYKMARIYLNVGEGRRVRGSDMYDAHHYVAASYTHVLVTNDRDFRATTDAIPNPTFTLNTFEEFVEQRLGVRRAR